MLLSMSDFSRRLLRWYGRSRRDLPWRVDPNSTRTVDPYHVLVSESMLQQTQVATVIPYFERFIARFPTLKDLAGAAEQEVLRHWQGLGYYSRARNLQAAARKVVSEHSGVLPHRACELVKLPGIGRYTAGAIASIAFEQRSPIVDGNVARVLCRIDRIESDPRDRETAARLWGRAEQLLPRRRVGDFNSALMELGATVCTPRSPQCWVCPVRAHCEAFAGGLQDRIPAPRKAKPTTLLKRRTFCIRRGESWLIEQRPASGRWASLWQFITIEADTTKLARPVLPVATSPPRRIGKVEHGLTHRRYQFDVFACDAIGNEAARTSERPRAWTTLAELGTYPLPRPHLKVAAMLEARAAVSPEALALRAADAEIPASDNSAASAAPPLCRR